MMDLKCYRCGAWPCSCPDGQCIVWGDCREVLPMLPKVDLVLTDPPYGLEGAVVRQGGARIEDWGNAGHNSRIDESWRAASVACLNGDGAYHAEFFAGSVAVERAMSLARAASLEPWRLFYFVKTAPAPTPRPTLMSGVELALISYVGKRPWFGGQHPDRWIGLSPNRLGSAVHPSQKPDKLIEAMLAALSAPGHFVLDPFLGSGTTLVAAKQLGRRGIGIEVEERWCDAACERLRQGVLDFGAA